LMSSASAPGNPWDGHSQYRAGDDFGACGGRPVRPRDTGARQFGGARSASTRKPLIREFDQGARQQPERALRETGLDRRGTPLSYRASRSSVAPPTTFDLPPVTRGRGQADDGPVGPGGDAGFGPAGGQRGPRHHLVRPADRGPRSPLTARVSPPRCHLPTWPAARAAARRRRSPQVPPRDAVRPGGAGRMT